VHFSKFWYKKNAVSGTHGYRRLRRKLGRSCQTSFSRSLGLGQSWRSQFKVKARKQGHQNDPGFHLRKVSSNAIARRHTKRPVLICFVVVFAKEKKSELGTRHDAKRYLPKHTCTDENLGCKPRGPFHARLLLVKTLGRD